MQITRNTSMENIDGEFWRHNFLAFTRARDSRFECLLPVSRAGRVMRSVIPLKARFVLLQISATDI